jgi:hypothetical protein
MMKGDKVRNRKEVLWPVMKWHMGITGWKEKTTKAGSLVSMLMWYLPNINLDSCY